MKAVFSGAQMYHAPKQFLSRGEIVGYPESPARARALLAGARAAGLQICAARQFEPAKLERAHSKPYLDFLASAFDEWRALPGAGPELMPSLRPLVRAARPATHIMGKAGSHMMDFSCAITADTWRSAHASAMTALTAADLVLNGERAAYALCRPPGHHAYAAAAGGFCYLNNAAIAALHLRAKHKKVAVLDIDVHHGNGTQAIFYKRPDILTVSIHADPADYYPYYWGHAAETGLAQGEGANLNIPLPVRSGDAAWTAALDQALERIAAFKPGALALSLGLDAHESDPLQGGAVTTACFERMAERVAKAGHPTVIVQEGGYLTDHLADNLAMFLVGFEGGLEQPVDAGNEPAAKDGQQD
jgi:acetoin utilization deacetylase AcuC-like enzyme